MENIIERKKRIAKPEISETPLFPREIFLDLTSFCNQSCVFCANRKIKSKSTMKSEFVKRTLTELYKCGTRDIGLYATGESFLVRKLAHYVKFAKDLGYEYIFITTNGALVTPETGKPVIDAGLDSIKFSISAGKRETYRKIHGKDDFDRVIENLKWVFKYRQDSGLNYRIYVTMVYTDKTKEEVEALKDIVMPYIDEWDPHSLTNLCGSMYENNQLAKIDTKNPRGRGQMEICFQPFRGFTITPEGYISACVIDYTQHLIVGDLNKATLEDIWVNDIYRKFRKRHINKDIKGLVCYNCMYNKNEQVFPLTPEYSRQFMED